MEARANLALPPLHTGIVKTQTVPPRFSYLRSAEFPADPVPSAAVLCSPGVRGKPRPERKGSREASSTLLAQVVPHIFVWGFCF